MHHVDPVLGSIGGVYFWWYGLGFAAGFFHLLLFILRSRASLGLSRHDAYALALCVCAGVLLGGRLLQVAFDEWPLYRVNPHLLPAVWLGGMATHGLMIGALVGLLVFSVWKRASLLDLADALVIPGAVLLGLGRIGNFIDGQIVGRITDVWWAVQFPDVDGFRHPVVLYDGLKNLLLVPYLLHVRRTNHTPGAVAARFVFWYASLRVVVDLFRDYPTFRLALGTGQTLNIVMMAIGLVLLYRSRLRRLDGRRRHPSGARTVPDESPTGRQRVAFASLLLLCLTIPSNWTQDVPARYASRHPGLSRTWLYPAIDTSLYRRDASSPATRTPRPAPRASRPATRASRLAPRARYPSSCLAIVWSWRLDVPS